MSKRSRALIVVLAVALCPLIALSCDAGKKTPVHTYSYTPGQAGTTLHVYATPAALALAPVISLTTGALAWVQNQGIWSYSLTAPSDAGAPTCDGVNLCVTAGGVTDGGAGYWLRSPLGLPRANLVATYYVDSVLGADANTCTSPGASACLTVDEICRRMGAQAPQVNIEVLIANYGGNVTSWQGCTLQPSGSGFVVSGTRVYNDGGGTPFFQGTVVGVTPWTAVTTPDAGQDAASIATVYVQASDGGPFGATAWPASEGFILEDENQCDGGAGTSGCVGYMMNGFAIDAGTFEIAGGTYVGSSTVLQPTAGDTVQIAQLSQVGNSAASSAIALTGGNFTLSNLWIVNPFATQIYSPSATGVTLYTTTSPQWSFGGGTFVSAYGWGQSASNGEIYLDNATVQLTAGTIVGGMYVGQGSVVRLAYDLFLGSSQLAITIGGNGSDGPGTVFVQNYIGYTSSRAAIPFLTMHMGPSVSWIQGPMIIHEVGGTSYFAGLFPSGNVLNYSSPLYFKYYGGAAPSPGDWTACSSAFSALPVTTQFAVCGDGIVSATY